MEIAKKTVQVAKDLLAGGAVGAYVHDGVLEAGAWLSRNSGTILTMAPVILAVTRTAAKMAVGVDHRVELREERNRHNYACYNRSAVHYWELNRKLTNTDWTAIATRRANGEKLSDILSDMKVLNR